MAALAGVEEGVCMPQRAPAGEAGCCPGTGKPDVSGPVIVFHGPGDQVGRIAATSLVQNVGAVFFHRPLAEEKLFGDFGSRKAVANQPEDLNFTFREDLIPYHRGLRHQRIEHLL